MKNKAEKIMVERVSGCSFELALWVVNLLEASHKAGYFDTGVDVLRKKLRERIVQCEANTVVLEAEDDI